MITLQDITTTEELSKFLDYPQLLALLVKEVRSLTIDDLHALAEAQIYCDYSGSTFEILLVRATNKEVCHA